MATALSIREKQCGFVETGAEVTLVKSFALQMLN